MAQRGLLSGSHDCCPRVRHRMQELRKRGGRMTRIVNLAVGFEPVRQWFNDKSAYSRIVAIQSPT
jgi:hypothetical protein